ncbi:MAG: DMT family transporter [Solidesulfovibrio sp. DCME]|uniref:DMT family transporter n=1 Tax=Solidesulfovibrio sp. DCME TaxID=3447380 RepID=UPI003D0E1E62
MPNTRLAWPAFFALTVATLLWGGSFIAMKIAMRGFSPLVVVFCRMALASLVFAVLWPRLGGFRAAKGDWVGLLFMAFCEPCLYFVFEANALTFTQASQAAMVTALLPLLTAVAAAFFLKEKLEAASVAGLTLAVAGVVVMSASGQASDAAPRPVLGNFLEFVAMCCAVGYIVTAKRLAARHHPLYLTAVQSFTGTVFFAPVLFFAPLPEALAPGPTLAVAFLGFGVTFVAYGLYNYGVSRAPAAKAAAFINLIPVFACLLAGVMLDEALTTAQWAGGLMALCGVALTSRPGRSKPA